MNADDGERAFVLAEYDIWQVKREQLSEAEGDGNYPASRDWHDSDDTATELLHRVVALLRPTS